MLLLNGEGGLQLGEEKGSWVGEPFRKVKKE